MSDCDDADAVGKARQSPEGRNRATACTSWSADTVTARFIGAVVSRFALDVVLGSSSRGGAKGLRAMLNLLASGDHIAITPDGPRGPRRVAAPGVAHLAAMSGVPVLPCAAQTTRRRALPTWDRMVAPLPFGRGVVVCLPTIAVNRDSWQDAVPAIGAAMTAAAERADRLCLA